MSVNHIYAIALSSTSTTPTWAISIQPKKTKRLFFHEHTQTTVYFGSQNGTSGRRNSDQVEGEELLVKILIGENSNPNFEKSTSETLEKVAEATESSELWLRDAVVALQHADLCGRFDVDDFMQLASRTLKSQQEHHESVAVEVDYLSELNRTNSVEEIHETRDAAMKKGKKESSHFGFWISKPKGVERKVRQRNSWERKDDPYGGMM